MKATHRRHGDGIRGKAAGTMYVCVVVLSLRVVEGAPVRFDNPDPAAGYTWTAPQWPPEGSLLDITRAADQQGLADAATSFYQIVRSWDAPDESWVSFHGPTPGGGYGDVANRDGMSARAPTAFAPGAMIGPAAEYTSQLTVGAMWDEDSGNVFRLYIGDAEPEYAGVRYSLDGGQSYHYGWILVKWNVSDYRFDALAWGYETQSDTPIAAGAPEPASVAILALAGAAWLGRRR